MFISAIIFYSLCICVSLSFLLSFFPPWVNYAFPVLELGLVDGQELAVADVTTPQTVLFKLHFTS